MPGSCPFNAQNHLEMDVASRHTVIATQFWLHPSHHRSPECQLCLDTFLSAIYCGHAPSGVPVVLAKLSERP
jgi:hypothetical protein